ncbi:MAG: hypothetical protein ACP5RG_00710 [Thermoplasmata archaeon]
MIEREPAQRVLSPELLGIDEIVTSGEDKAVKYGLSEMGLLINRFMLAGQFTSRSDEEKQTVVKVRDSLNEVFLYVGQFYDYSLELLDEIEEGNDIIAIGKISISNNQGYISKRFYAEKIFKVTSAERKYAEISSAYFLNKRIINVSRIISSGIRERDEISKIMESERLARGIEERLQRKGSIDVEKFRAIVESVVTKSNTGNRDIVLQLIKDFREISYEELNERLSEKIGAEELEKIVENLLSEGEITEIKSGTFKYIP